ncbi:MAG: response regulator transcription factor [Anaerolineae bacterium]
MESLLVLLVEGDEAAEQGFIGQTLSKRKYTVIHASDAYTAMAKAYAEWPDLVVVNAAGNFLHAQRVCEALDRSNLEIPRLIISDDDTQWEQLRGDAYLIMPFSPRQLAYRMKKALKVQPDRFLRVGDICVDTLKRAVKYRGQVSHLTPRELALLTYLMRNAGRDVSRIELMREVWGTEYAGDTRTIEVHIRWLRCKLEEDPKHPQHIRTVRRMGYRLEISR